MASASNRRGARFERTFPREEPHATPWIAADTIRALQGLRVGDVILSVNGYDATDRKVAIDALDASQSYVDIVYLPGNGQLPSNSFRRTATRNGRSGG
jgi:hypothetical protein